MQKHFVIATAGHVDHGKSSLVKALTGTDPDRLPEEKARQITIDLGFAELNLRGPGGEDIHAAIVDVPGHEDFVRNMIAGVGSIDLALLVVAADDGWMPQTEEHLQILQYLGVTHAVIALTKIDIGKANETELQIRVQLRDTAFANAPIVRTELGDAIEQLKQAIASELSRLEPQRDIGEPRLFVDRAFTLRGVGTVVTGTLTGGSLPVGDAVIVQPRGAHSRIRSLQSHGRDVDLAQPGTRTAINLPDTMIDRDVRRGDVITTRAFQPSATIDVLLTRSPRAERDRIIKSGGSAYVHHGTSRILARIILAERASLATGQSGLAQLRLSQPVPAFLGDRFVIRDASEQHTIAGGIVLQLDAPPEKVRSAQSLAALSERASAVDDIDIWIRTELALVGAGDSARLLQRSHFSSSEIAEALQRLERRGEIFLSGDIAADMNTWRALRERAIGLIDANHRDYPQRAGVELSDLRSAFTELAAEIVDELIVDLCRDDFARVGSTVARQSHRPALPQSMRATAEALRKRVAANPFDPPPRKQLVTDALTDQALRFLIDQGEFIEINEDVVLSRDAFVKIKTRIAEFISSNGPATVSLLRNALASSRRVMVPLLERLDREGFTRRIGDQRVLATLR